MIGISVKYPLVVSASYTEIKRLRVNNQVCILVYNMFGFKKLYCTVQIDLAQIQGG